MIDPLNNWRRHQQDITHGRVSMLRLDPYASGSMLDGWRTVDSPPDPLHPPWPVSPPRTSLLRFEWRRHGLLDPYTTPGPLR